MFQSLRDLRRRRTLTRVAVLPAVCYQILWYETTCIMSLDILIPRKRPKELRREVYSRLMGFSTFWRCDNPEIMSASRLGLQHLALRSHPLSHVSSITITATSEKRSNYLAASVLQISGEWRFSRAHHTCVDQWQRLCQHYAITSSGSSTENWRMC